MLSSLAAIGCALGGCGGESMENQAKQVADDYLDALQSGDGEAACALLTPASVAEIEDPSAQEKLRAASLRHGTELAGEIPAGPGKCPENQVSIFATVTDPIETDGVEIDGPRATVDLEGGTALVLRDLDGQWKVDLGLTAQQTIKELQANP